MSLTRSLTQPLTRPLAAAVTAGVGGGSFAYESRIVFAGDSITANGSTMSGSDLLMQNTGFFNVAQRLSGQRAYLPTGGNKGISGNTSQDLLARYSAVTALSPKIVCILIGTNDLPAGIPSATTISYISQMLAANAAIGAKTILLKILPRASSGTPMVADWVTRWEAVNAWIAAQASASVVVVDAEPSIGNMDANHSMAAGHSSDFVHPNALGAYKIGKLVSAAITRLVSAGDFIAPIVGTGFATNGLMTGTAGTKDAMTGQVATGWEGYQGNAGGATVVASKIARASGFGDWQQVTVSGTYTGNSRIVLLRHSLLSPVGVTSGDVVELFGELEMDLPNDAIAAVGMRMTVNNGAGGAIYVDALGALAEVPWPEAYAGTVRSLPYTLAAVPTRFNIECVVVLGDTAGTDPVSGVFRFGRVGLRKL